MRIACLQFAPQVGDVDNNLNRADSVLSRANPEDLDLLVLPELAFSGYNFKSLTDISPFLEPSGAGITSLWARTTALKYNCVVAAGYPEKVDVTRNWPTSPEYYNSVIVVNEEGETIANYRKSHLYYTDETWALEGSDGFYKGYIPGVGRVALGICMDINPYRFETPWSAYEFAFHVLDVTANIVVLSMAWLTTEDARSFSRTPKEPDMETMAYWITRLEPLIRADNDDEIIVIFANRTGSEDEAVYAGTSAVIGIQHGEVSVYGLLGRGEKELLVVDTSLPPFAKMVYRPSDEANSVRGASDLDRTAPSNDKKPNGVNSPAQSAASATSSTSGSSMSNKSKTHNSGGVVPSVGISRDPVQRIFGGHVVITQDILSPVANNFPSTPFEESPSSPRYFWLPPEQLKTPDPALTRSSTSHSLIKRANSSTLPHRAKSVQATNNSSDVPIPHEVDHSLELNELVETLRKVTRDTAASAACPVRPESPKSRNASRTGRGERSDSVRARRPPSVFGSQVQATVTEGAGNITLRPESPKSRNASRTRSRTRTVDTPVQTADYYHVRSGSKNQARLPTPLDLKAHSPNPNYDRRPAYTSTNTESDQERLQDGTPDMEKLGADLLVFEEREGRPRRDSLECHADEDDFVVFHASMRRDRAGAGKPSGETDVERLGSQKGPTPKHTGSPGLSSTKSPKQAWTGGKPQVSPDLPDARAISRGRQRTTKPLEPQSSPKSIEYKSSNLSSSIEDWSKAQVSPPTSSFSRRYKSPVATQGASRGPKVDDSRQRRDSSARLGAATDGSSLTSMSSKKVPRDKSQRPFENSYSAHGSSIRTTEVISAPTTPDSVPVTPKAMVLEPNWDKGPPLEVVEVDKRACHPADSSANRPKSVIW